MSCNCSNAKNIPSCIDKLTIGEVTDGTLGYSVYFKTPDGRIDKYAGDDLTYTDIIEVENPEVRIGTMYEVWIAKNDAVNINERVPFTPIGASSEVTCINVTFDFCDGVFAIQQITLA